MIKTITLLPILAFVLTLSGCLSTPSKPVSIVDWQQFLMRQTSLTEWRMTAKLGYQSPQDSGSAWLEWQQQQRYFDIHLSGPFGAGATRIKGEPEYVVMSQPGKEQEFAASSDDLTQQLLGLPLPVNALTYWLRGIPDPNSESSERSMNADGTMASLAQDNWTLQFSRYNQQGRWLLPSRISGQSGALSFKLIIKEWAPQ